MDLGSRPNNSIAGLVSGIITDIRNLVAAELKLGWAEFHGQLHKAKLSAASLVFALGLALLGAFLVMQMLVQLACVYLGFPLWGAYGVVGLLAMGVSALLVAFSRRWRL